MTLITLVDQQLRQLKREMLIMLQQHPDAVWWQSFSGVWLYDGTGAEPGFLKVSRVAVLAYHPDGRLAISIDMQTTLYDARAIASKHNSIN